MSNDKGPVFSPYMPQQVCVCVNACVQGRYHYVYQLSCTMHQWSCLLDNGIALVMPSINHNINRILLPPLGNINHRYEYRFSHIILYNEAPVEFCPTQCQKIQNIALLTHLPLKHVVKYFQTHLKEWYPEHFIWKWPHMNATESPKGFELVQTGSKPLPKSAL